MPPMTLLHKGLRPSIRSNEAQEVTHKDIEITMKSLATLLLITALFCGCGATDTTKTETPPQAAVPAPPVPAPVVPATAEPEAPAPAIDLATLALKVDPVCSMSLEEYPPTSTAEHGGKTYGFCSDFCKKKFVASPESMLARQVAAPAEETPKP